MVRGSYVLWRWLITGCNWVCAGYLAADGSWQVDDGTAVDVGPWLRAIAHRAPKFRRRQKPNGAELLPTWAHHGRTPSSIIQDPVLEE